MISVLPAQSIAWDAVPGAAEYHFRVVDQLSSDVIVDDAVTGTSIVVQDHVGARYYARPLAFLIRARAGAVRSAFSRFKFRVQPLRHPENLRAQ